MRFFYYSLCVIITLKIPVILFSQGGNHNPDNFQKMTDILPPPPNAAAIIKHGGISVSKNTGSPSVNIPLYTLKGKNIVNPVSLSYTSTGIKVDELASRVGMGWVLLSGGVITRTVRGWADETHPRIIPWWSYVGINWETFKFMKDVTDSWFYGGFDAEPDMFSFNYPGGSGSFVLDHQMNPVQQTYSNQKIVHNFSGTDWNFKITDAHGVVYFFGGAGRVEKTKRVSNCGKNFDGFTTTAWYINKIVHPSGEEIVFNYQPHSYSYETGFSQNYDYTFPVVRVEGCCYCPGWESGCPGAQSHAMLSSPCINRVITEGVLLDNITCSNTFQKITFTYTSRPDCGDKLIQTISLINTFDNSISGSFAFGYNIVSANILYNGAIINEPELEKTPYLITLTESGIPGSGVHSKLHRFQYYDPEVRPRRLSYAQDHWGYFNGKNNNNFFPKPPTNDLQLMSRFPLANANREPDGAFGSKGMLCGIIYPTGGKDSIVYEPNQSTNNYNTQTQLRHELNCSVTGNGTTTAAQKTAYIYIGNSQTADLRITMQNTEPGGNFDPLHDFGKVFIYTSSGTLVYEELFSPGNSTPQFRYVNLTGNTTGVTRYTVKIIAQRSTHITTHLELKYKSFNQSPGSVTQLTGGQRVKSILSSNENNVPVIRRYYYGDIGNLNASSGLTMVPAGNYIKNYEVRTTCFLVSTPPQSAKNYCQHTALYSSSLSGLYNYQSSPVSYTSVIESIGENLEGGCTLSRFRVIRDQKGQVLWGNEMPDAPVTSFSNYGNGNLIEQTEFKKVGTSLIPVKKTDYTYKMDARGFKSVWGYVVNKKYEFGPTQPTTDSLCVKNINNPYHAICMGSIQGNMECFDMMRYEFPSYWIYNDTSRVYEYDPNGQNPVLTQTINYYDNATFQQLSRTETFNSKGEQLKNEFKYPSDFPSIQIYNEMTTKNIIAPIIEEKSFNGQSELSHTKNHYFKQPVNNDYLVYNIEKSVGGNLIESIGEILTYDAKSNICEYRGKDGVTHCIIWGYNYLYPVAKISGATYTSVISLIPGGVAGIQSLDSTALLNALNPIRQGLPNAVVTTYTYKHMAGVKTLTDPNNNTTTFNYDGYNRLIEVIDKDGNIIKKNDYTYTATQLEKMGLYVNETQSGMFTTQHCNSGYRGSQVNYYVPAGTYYSVISVADANAKALADLQINGQAFANRTGYCILETSNCTGEGLAIIGCGCELGQKICISATENPVGSGSWTIYYKYSWSDGSESGIYGPVSITCIGAAFKMINCNCREGIKVYISSTQVTTGPNAPYWICEFYYYWPDGSQSPVFQEVHSSPCQLTIQ